MKAKSKKKSFMGKFIDLIEKGGNKLPHPFILFTWLILITMVASFLLSKMGFEVTYFGVSKKLGEASKETTIKVVNLLSRENLQYLVREIPTIFVSYAPLKLVMIMMVASAFIEKTGFFETFMKKYLLKAPKSLITFALVFIAINANLMSDAGTIFAISIGGVVFVALGRNPLIGIILGYVGASGGFTANLFLAGTDALLAGITENAVRSMGLDVAINPVVNYFFMASATFIMAITVTLFTEKVIVPMVGDGDGVIDNELLSKHKLTLEQEKGLKYALYGFIFFIVVMLMLTVPQGAFFRNSSGNFLPKSPLFKSIIVIIAFLFMSTGIPYGIATKYIKTSRDIPRIISLGITQSVPFLTTTLAAAIFIDLVNKSNIFKIIAIKGAEILKEGDVGLIALCLTVILITTFVNPFMTSGSSKWLLIAPMVVPMFTVLNVHPAYAQLAYRIGDSCTNIISPLHSALPILLGLLAEYQMQGKIPLRPGETEQREMGMGTIFSLTIPYSMVLLLTMTVMFIVWIIFKLPIGPGVTMNLL
ncbi:MAG: AbgT family transporter [Fusobacterium sp. JB019]|nr:AbgT family transporter [Fusobacterium sp. JB020]MDP0507072.1 AbgT family transporter [Fusobacterium sp. JB019]